MSPFEPFGERAADMDRNAQMLVGFKDLKKRKVAVLIGLLKDVIEITDRLVIMQDERSRYVLLPDF